MQQQDAPAIDVYTDALLDAARKQNAVEAIFEEARQIRQILAKQSGLLQLMSVPAIEKENKKALIRKAFTGQISSLMLNLPLILIDYNRGNLWDAILESFMTAVEQEKGIMNAELATVQSLSADEMAALKKTLEEFTGKQLHISFRQDKNLIGGVHFRCDDTLIDTSIATALGELRAKLEAVRIDL